MRDLPIHRCAVAVVYGHIPKPRELVCVYLGEWLANLHGCLIVRFCLIVVCGEEVPSSEGEFSICAMAQKTN